MFHLETVRTHLFKLSYFYKFLSTVILSLPNYLCTLYIRLLTYSILLQEHSFSFKDNHYLTIMERVECSLAPISQGLRKNSRNSHRSSHWNSANSSQPSRWWNSQKTPSACDREVTQVAGSIFFSLSLPVSSPLSGIMTERRKIPLCEIVWKKKYEYNIVHMYDV